jgi:16S rRNA (guanine527-N7)-methyltransferase
LKAVEVADIGSGAGFPGIPIKLWAPDIHLTLIESNHKKAAFLREVARTLTLTNVNVQIIRAEDLAHSRQDATASPDFDVVTLRAVERFDTILPVAASLVAPAGRLALLVSSSQVSSARVTMPHFFPHLAHHLTWSEPLPIPSSRSRVVLIGVRSPSKEPEKLTGGMSRHSQPWI